MLPMVSSRDPPTGHLLMSSVPAFLFSHSRRMLLPMSNTESMPVASKESDSDDMAAYTVDCQM